MSAPHQPRYDSESIRRLFDEMSATYGRTNLVSSFGFTSRWRTQAVAGLALERADTIVDLMSGMGEIWASLAVGLRRSSTVYGVDLSSEMVRRSSTKWPFEIVVEVSNALVWTPPAPADVVVSSFGLKTFNREQQRTLAQAVSRMLRKGGEFSFVEISVPSPTFLRIPFLFYLRWVIPLIGRLMLGNPDCYRMLWHYTVAFGDASHFVDCLREAGLQAAKVSYFFGCATGAKGRK